MRPRPKRRNTPLKKCEKRMAPSSLPGSDEGDGRQKLLEEAGVQEVVELVESIGRHGRAEEGAGSVHEGPELDVLVPAVLSEHSALRVARALSPQETGAHLAYLPSPPLPPRAPVAAGDEVSVALEVGRDSVVGGEGGRAGGAVMETGLCKRTEC